MFGGKNCKLIAFSAETSGWAGQLSIIVIFHPCISNLDRARATIPHKVSHPSMLFLRLMSAREVTNVLEAS